MIWDVVDVENIVDMETEWSFILRKMKADDVDGWARVHDDAA